MVTDNEALEAAKKVREYCKTRYRDCSQCVFNDTAPLDKWVNMCVGNSAPESWEFDEDETNMR